VIFPLEGTPVLFGSPPHMHDKPFPVYKAFTDWITDTRALSGLKLVVETLRATGYEQRTIGLVGFKSAGPYASNIFSREQYQFLLKELPAAQFVEATPIVEKIRTIKSLEEIEMLKRSGEISRLKVDAMIRMAKPESRNANSSPKW